MPVLLLSLSWVLPDLMAEAGHAAGEVDTTGGNKYKQIFGLRTVHLLSIWALIYVGVEVTLGGGSFHHALQPELLLTQYLQAGSSLSLRKREAEAPRRVTYLLASLEVCNSLSSYISAPLTDS